MEWINVNDRLPDDATRVLVFVWSRQRFLTHDRYGDTDVDVCENCEIYIAKYYKGEFQIEKEEHAESEEVLAWMSLPPYPND